MNIWFPIIEGGSGVTVFTHELAGGLEKLGHTAEVQTFSHTYQYAPWLLKAKSAPVGTDIILANSWNAFAFKRKGIPLVSVQHLFVLDKALRPYKSTAQHLFHSTLVRYFERETANTADQLVAVSEYTGRAYREHLGEKRVKVIQNGIDTEFFSPSPTPIARSADDSFQLLFVGNFTRRKGADMLPKIMDLLGSSFSLSYTSGLRVKEEQKIRDNMHPLGRLDREQTRAAYRSADVLLFPTRLEGLPLVALEAMACGTPVAGTNGSSLPEVIEDNVDGMLCPQDNVAAFADRIKSLSEDRQDLSRMGDLAREKAAQHFSLKRMTTDYANLLREL